MKTLHCVAYAIAQAVKTDDPRLLEDLYDALDQLVLVHVDGNGELREMVRRPDAAAAWVRAREALLAIKELSP